jgi:hypothetical protein
VQDLHDRKACIQSDEIGELQRAHRVIGTEPHCGVDGIDRPNALIQGVNGLIDHWQQDPVDDEGWKILCDCCGFSEFTDEAFGGLEGLILGRDSANKLDELHPRHGVHKMNADEAFRTVGNRSKPGN